MATGTTTPTTRSDVIAKLDDLTRDIHVAMLTTTMPDGVLRSRPMAAPQRSFDGDFWFFTGWNTEKVHELLTDAHVNLTFVKHEDNRYVSASGRATIVRDRGKAKELWSPAFKAWFPKGLDDSNLALLRVRVEQAEYWDAPSSTMVHIAGFI
ncbi:MAG: pyridoxamine 5'-phosphate oxidase family protein [Planctomycetota bacterium]